MDSPEPQKNPRRFVALGAIVLVIGFMVLLTLRYGREIAAIVTDREALRAWLDSFGVWSFVVYIGLQILQVVIFVIPGEVIQLAGGYCFGLGPGLLLAVTGAVAGTIICFGLARLLGRTVITGFIPESNLAKFDSIIASPRAQIIFFLLFLIPGLPKDVLCYVGGLSPLGLWRFVLISTLGRLPALTASIFFGSAVAEANWTLAWIIGGVATVLFLLGVWKRQQIHDFLDRSLGGRQKKDPDGPGSAE